MYHGEELTSEANSGSTIFSRDIIVSLITIQMSYQIALWWVHRKWQFQAFCQNMTIIYSRIVILWLAQMSTMTDISPELNPGRHRARQSPSLQQEYFSVLTSHVSKHWFVFFQNYTFWLPVFWNPDHVKKLQMWVHVLVIDLIPYIAPGWLTSFVLQVLKRQLEETRVSIYPY